MAERTEQIFTQAGLSFTWVQSSFNGILAQLRANSGQDCAVGWAKNAERMAFARFSEPFYRDKPIVGLMRSNMDLAPGITLKSLLSRPGIKLLYKENFYLGPYVDEIIHNMDPNNIMTATYEISAFVRMIAEQRADIYLFNSEEATYYQENGTFRDRDVKIYDFPDSPRNNYRYFLCSLQTPPETMDRLNRAIHSTHD
jgi:polar amino acid transport system substrate-binding protein